ncbi:MAG: hypothetical protein AAF515_10960 [Pseudomonadota bacterium]
MSERPFYVFEHLPPIGDEQRSGQHLQSIFQVLGQAIKPFSSRDLLAYLYSDFMLPAIDDCGYTSETAQERSDSTQWRDNAIRAYRIRLSKNLNAAHLVFVDHALQPAAMALHYLETGQHARFQIAGEDTPLLDASWQVDLIELGRALERLITFEQAIAAGATDVAMTLVLTLSPSAELMSEAESGHHQLASLAPRNEETSRRTQLKYQPVVDIFLELSEKRETATGRVPSQREMHRRAVARYKSEHPDSDVNEQGLKRALSRIKKLG